ncbi:MAG: M55 family metallopeptidase [Armatimonadota bacterium]|nr:M55 family metallopeptidase [Armatimonadota bacterium]
MKVYIATDMEGITGIVDRAQISPPGVDLRRGRNLLTEDTNAAIRGALAAGATDIIVSSGHGGNGMRNIIDENLHPAAWLVSGDTRRSSVEGMDDSFDALVLIGFHTRHGLSGVLDHTITARDIYEIRVHGRPIGEIGLYGLAAGHFGVPVVLVSGDDRLAAETREWFPWAVPVVVKYAIGRHAARLMHPRRGQRLIEEQTTEALRRLATMKPLRLPAPITVELQFKRTAHADEADRIPGVERVDDCTVRAQVPDGATAVSLVRTCIKLGATAQNDPMR